MLSQMEQKLINFFVKVNAMLSLIFAQFSPSFIYFHFSSLCIMSHDKIGITFHRIMEMTLFFQEKIS